MKVLFSRVAAWSAEALGHPFYVMGSVVICLVWLATGPFTDWSDTWQLIINTLTTILTWLMVGLLQHTQNRDTRAIQAKLDELIRAVPEANNAIRGIEQKIEEELEEVEEHVERSVELSSNSKDG